MKWNIGIKMLDFKKTYTLPFKFDIPNYAQEFLEKKTLIKSRIKFLKRYLYINIKGQKLLEIYSILPKHNNILWINISAPSLGDSLMDLSSRIMLKGRKIDLEIKKNAPPLENIFNWIGQTSIEEYIALSGLSQGYIGMDTLNMHIAAAQNKRVFAIFGPTILSMWSPWYNKLQRSATIDMPKQTYGDITIFQANMPCVACGKAGCNNKGISECLDNIVPQVIINEVEKWFKHVRF